VVNQLLRDKGIRSLLGVPLVAGGQLLGVLHVGTVSQRRFDDEDVELRSSDQGSCHEPTGIDPSAERDQQTESRAPE
jgi:hypothetical protein